MFTLLASRRGGHAEWSSGCNTCFWWRRKVGNQHPSDWCVLSFLPDIKDLLAQSRRHGVSAGKISDSIVGLKKEVVGFLSQHMAASNLADDEGTVLAVHGAVLPPRMLRLYTVAVNMLEEVVSDAEEAPKKAKAGGQKRKR